MNDVEEKILIRQALAGDDLAFRELIVMYHKTVERFARQIGVHENDLSDVTQEVFLKVYRFLNKYSRGKFSTWLYSITLNVSRDFFKKRSRENEKLKKTMNEPQAAYYLENLDLSEDEEALYNAIQKLDEKYRVPIVLFYFHDKSIQDIATILKMKEATTKTRLKRGKEYLKEELMKGGFLYES